MDIVPLTRAEYDAHIGHGTLRLAFTGTSNIGKSYRSKVLRNEMGFMWYQVDKEIIRSLGLDSMEGISEWLGFPDDERYQEREGIYLDKEAQHTRVDFLADTGKNLAFDTTGSVIYLRDNTVEWLRENCLIVHLEADEHAIAAAIRQIFDDPKPLVWNGFYVQEGDESRNETLKRCYPKLLSDRLERYRAMAHMNIPAGELHDKSGEETLAIIRACLPE